MSKLKFHNSEQASQQKSSAPLPFPAETANILDPLKCVQSYLYGFRKSYSHNKYIGVYFFPQCQLLSKESSRVLYQASPRIVSMQTLNMQATIRTALMHSSKSNNEHAVVNLVWTRPCEDTAICVRIATHYCCSV